MDSYYVIYVTPGLDVLPVPEGFDVTFEPGDSVIVHEDRFEWSDTEPDETYKLNELTFDLTPQVIAFFKIPPELVEVMSAWVVSETIAETRWLEDPDAGLDGEGNPIQRCKVRIRYPVEKQRLAGGVVPLYTLKSDKLPKSWGGRAQFWGVFTTAPTHKRINEYIYETLGFGPVAGAIAVLDPDDNTKFLDHAVREFTGVTLQENLQRLSGMVTGLKTIGIATVELDKMVADATSGVPAKAVTVTEDRLVRSLVSDLGFTLKDLQRASLRMD